MTGFVLAQQHNEMAVLRRSYSSTAIRTEAHALIDEYRFMSTASQDEPSLPHQFALDPRKHLLIVRAASFDLGAILFHERSHFVVQPILNRQLHGDGVVQCLHDSFTSRRHLQMASGFVLA